MAKGAMFLTVGLAALLATAMAVEAAPAKPDIAGQLGKATPRTQTKLKHQKAMRDGGAREELPAPEGKVFLVLRFEETAGKDEQIVYSEQEVGLELKAGEKPVRAHGVTTNGANPESKDKNAAQEPWFSTEVWMTQFKPRAGLPFELAFVVPADAKSATLVLGKTKQEVKW